ncbi:MAG: hypothetical protein MOB07_29305 [Acidobacteria bacterium]|nr:hypothetical protein [Acidobacteriota bacterium]
MSGDWFALVGDMAQRNVSEMFVDKIFIGVDGIHAEHGLTTNYPDQAAIHRAMMRQARQRIIVADYHKIGVVGASLRHRLQHGRGYFVCRHTLTPPVPGARAECDSLWISLHQSRARPDPVRRWCGAGGLNQG